MIARMVAAVIALLFVVPVNAHASDTNVAGYGPAQITVVSGGVTSRCTSTMTLGFVVRGTQFFVSENSGVGLPVISGTSLNGCLTFLGPVTRTNLIPASRQCLPANATVGSPTHTLSQSGMAYTIQSTFTWCDGTIEKETISIAIAAGVITYSHTFPAGPENISISARLTRVA